MSTTTQGSTTEKIGAVTSSAQDVGGHAADAEMQVAQTVKQGAQDVMGDVREQGAQLTAEVSQQLQGLAEQASAQLREHASTQTDRAATQLRVLSRQARAFAEGRTDEAGPLPQYAQQATEKLSAIAGRLENGGVDGALSDVRRFARRKPGTFLLITAAAGFTAGRVLRGAKTAQTEPSAQPLVASSAPTIHLDEAERNSY